METTKRRVAPWKIISLSVLVLMIGFVGYAVFKPEQPRFGFLEDQTVVSQEVLSATDKSGYHGKITIYKVKGDYKQVQETLQQALAEEGGWEPVNEWEMASGYIPPPSFVPPVTSTSPAAPPPMFLPAIYLGEGNSTAFRNKGEGIQVLNVLVKKAQLLDRFAFFDELTMRKEKGFVSVVVIEPTTGFTGMFGGLKKILKDLLGRP